MPPNPGVQAVGAAAGAAAANPGYGPAYMGGMSGGFSVNTSDLDNLHGKLTLITTDIGNLADAVDKLTGKLTAAGAAFTSAISGAPGAGGKGSTITSAPVTAFGGGNTGRGIALGAAGEIGAQWAGQINTGLGNLQQGYTGLDLSARQMNTITGAGFLNQQPGAGGAVNAMTGINSASPQDLTTAMYMLQANPLLMSRPGSANWNRMKSFMNTAQRLNPAMTASGAMTMANQLTSPQAMQFMTQRGVASAGGGLFNARTGNINDPNQVFKSVLEAITGQKNLSPAQAKAWMQNPERRAAIQQNAQLQMGLTPLATSELFQYAGAGMNLNKAAPTGAVAASLLKRTTAGTKTGASVFETTAGTQNDINTVMANLQGFAQGLVGPLKPLLSLGVASAAATAGLLGMSAKLLEVEAILKLLGSGAAGEEGAAGGLLSKIPGLGTAGGATATGAGGTAVGALGPLAALMGAHYGGQFLQNKLKNKKGPAAAVGRTALNVLTPNSHGLNVLNNATGMMNPVDWLKGLIHPGGTPLGNLLGVGQNTGLHLPSWLNDIGDPSGLPGPGTTKGMNPTLSRRLGAMFKANPNLQLSSGARTNAQQAALYAIKGGKGVARPGRSPHQRGVAADVGPPSQFGWIAKNASNFGLARPDQKEPWHLQAMGDANSGGAATITGAQVVTAAEKDLGTPYVWGGSTPGKGLDCSGLAMVAYAAVGITLPHYTYSQMKMGTPVKDIASAQPGDLLFYENGGHVTIYIGGGKQIEAQQTGTNVMIDNVGTPFAIRRIVGGGAGQTVAAAAQQQVGQPSNDQHSGSSGIGVVSSAPGTSLTNTFLGQVSGSWLSGGGGAGPLGSTATGGGGGGTGGGTTTPAGTSTAGNTAVLGGGGGSIANPSAFSKAVLAGLGLPSTVADVTDINAWQQAEGQWGARGSYNAAQMHNPLNTRLNMPGSSDLGGLTTSYPTWAEGVAASVSTIKQSNMSGIMAALTANDNLASFSSALSATPWASSHYSSGIPAPSGVYAVGDPQGPLFSGPSGGTATGRSIVLNMPIQVVSASQQDAQRLAQMVLQELKSQDQNTTVGTN